MSDKIRILLVDDHALIREGIRAMLASNEIDVVGSVSSGEEAVNKVQEVFPDVVLMDIVLKGMNGIEATRWIREQHSQVKVILLSMEVKKEFLAMGIQCGISGYLHKDVSSDILKEAIRQVFHGGKYFNEAITNLVFEDFYNKTKVAPPSTLKLPAFTPLTRREEDVLAEVAQGLSNREVAEKLFISIKTVETHKAHILEKLGLKNTAELVKYAIKHKLVPL